MATEAMLVACPTDGALNRVPIERIGGSPRCGTCHNPLFLGRTLVLNAGNLDRHIAKSELPVVVDFWASWCGPCRMMAPAFESAAAKLEPQVRLAKLDTEAEPGIAGRYGIRSIPSMILFHKGREVVRASGAMPEGAIVQWVRQGLAGLD